MLVHVDDGSLEILKVDSVKDVICMESEIRKAHTNKEIVVAVFFRC